jgi:hypothetical protein
MLLNHIPEHTWIIAMTDYALYIDDSGHPADKPYVIAAGFVSTEAQWLIFEEKWRDCLLRLGLDAAFHMTDFMSRPLKSLKRDWILGTLVNLIKAHTHQRFVAAVDMAAYKKVNEKYALEEWLGAPFALAARNIAKDVRVWQKEEFQAEDRLLIFVEEGTKHYGDMEQVFKRDGVPAPVRLPKSTSSLQPADMLGWEVFKYLQSGIESKNMKRLLPKQGNFGGIFLEKDLEDTCKLSSVPLREEIGPTGSIAFHSERKRKRKRTIK